MCCLKYEQDTYENLLKAAPRQGSQVKTPDGIGTVDYVSLLKGLVKVRFEKNQEKTMKEFEIKDVTPVKKQKQADQG